MRSKIASVTLGLAVAAGSLAITSCSSYSPQGHYEITKSNVDLESRNFNVRKLGAQGSAERLYLFGFPFGRSATGLAPDMGAEADMQSRAYSELNGNWDGQGSCVYHNINEEWSSYGLPPLFFFHQYTVTADIYEFDSEYVDYASRGERGQ